MTDDAAARFSHWWSLVEAGLCTYCGQPMRCVAHGKDVHAEPCGHCLYEGALPQAALVPREEAP